MKKIFIILFMLSNADQGLLHANDRNNARAVESGDGE